MDKSVDGASRKDTDALPAVERALEALLEAVGKRPCQQALTVMLPLEQHPLQRHGRAKALLCITFLPGACEHPPLLARSQ